MPNIFNTHPGRISRAQWSLFINFDALRSHAWAWPSPPEVAAKSRAIISLTAQRAWGPNRIRERERHKKYENLLRIRQRGRHIVLRIFRLHHKLIGLCYFGQQTNGQTGGPIISRPSSKSNVFIYARVWIVIYALVFRVAIFYLAVSFFCLITTHCWKCEMPTKSE